MTKKELGQHWLSDKGILNSIAECADLKVGDSVLEIGPGLGTLTEKLANSGAEVLALEFDRELIKGLKAKFSNCDNVAIREGDIRSFDYISMPKNYKVVANIPYYLTSNLIKSLSETNNPPKLVVLLIQKEVAQRLCAIPGDMSILSCTSQFYFECSLGMEVPAKYFTPPPKVDSQVVILSKRSAKLFYVDESKFFNLIKAGFSEKRKTLRNSLSSSLNISKTDVESILEHAGVEPSSRAQQLSLKEWHELYLAYNNSYES